MREVTSARRCEAEEDRELLARAAGGDQRAFESLVTKHQAKAFAIAYGHVRDAEDAREIVQEAFFRVHRNLRRFEGASSFFTWLYRIITNLSIDLLRRPNRREPQLLEDCAWGVLAVSEPFCADPYESLLQGELKQRLTSALNALPPYHRAVIEMREAQGMSYQEMADVMGVSKGTIMSRLFHARQKLQRALSDCRCP